MASTSVTLTSRPLLLQQLFCRLPVAHDQAQDAVLLGLGDAEGEDVDFGAGQKFDRGTERAGFVFQEEGELLEFHIESGGYILR